MNTIALGLVVWTLAGALTAIPLCLILKRSDPSSLTLHDDAKQDGTELTGAGGADPFFHAHSTIPGAE